MSETHQHYKLYQGTSSYNQPMVENVYCVGLQVYFQGTPNSGAGFASSTLKFTDAFGTDYPIQNINTTSGASTVFSIYPGLTTTTTVLSGTSSVAYNGVMPKKWHIDTVTNGTIGYSISVNELP